jgi:SPP1 gp7 family putative phage head morphogenesis protein
MKITPPKKKPHTWLFPQGQEIMYTKDLLSLSRELAKIIREVMYPAIPSMVEEVQRKTPTDRQDDYLDRLKSLIVFIRKAIQGKVDETILQAENVARNINQFNYNQFQKINENVLGVDLFVSEPWLLDQLKLFSAQNAQLITSLPDQELERVAGYIERGLQDGTSIREIEKDIQKSFGITRRRAKLIARDQTTKLNASLTKLRQQEVGVTEYVWQTSGDERVRPAHRANDGKTFRWDKPPATGHPGSDVNCRCVALPVLDNLLDLG